MDKFAQSPAVLTFDDFVRIYFCSRPPADKDGMFVSRIGFIEVDRDDLFRITRISNEPVISLGDRGTFDEFGTNPVSVIRDGNAVFAFYAGWTRCESVPFNGAIGVARSDDNGEFFHRLGPGPVVAYSIDEPCVVGSPKIRQFKGTWHLHYAAGQKWLANENRPEPVYKIRHATSHDGIHWTKENRNLIPDKLGEDECQAGGDVIEYCDRYHMFFSYRFPTGFKSKERGYRIGYAYSDDLVSWHRYDESAGITVSDKGWDSEMVSYAHLFELDGTLYMLYQGNGIGASGFGLAQMISYQPTELL